MINSLLRQIDSLVGIPEAKAHYDIPCKIYDPISAQRDWKGCLAHSAEPEATTW